MIAPTRQKDVKLSNLILFVKPTVSYCSPNEVAKLKYLSVF